MKLSEFIKNNDVDFSYNRVEPAFLAEIANAIGAELGPQMKRYLLDYGYLGYKFIELYGVNVSEGLRSDMIQRTKLLHGRFENTRGLIALEDRGDGDYCLVDSGDMTYRFLDAGVELTPLGLTLEEYILKRFLSIS